MLPILIGSKALELHGYNVSTPKDIDIICDISQAQGILWNADIKFYQCVFGFSNEKLKNDDENLKLRKRLREERVCRDKNDKEDDDNDSRSEDEKSLPTKMKGYLIIDISLIENDNCSSGKKLLYKLCNNDADKNVIKLDLNNDKSLDVILPPIELIYALYCGHVHRIPKVSSSQRTNINIWEKYMSRYSLIRSKYGYKKLDQLITNKTGSAYEIFSAEFEYVNQKIGDAPSLEEKPESMFFKDNVNRYLPHDELHDKVAKMNRGEDAKPLFPKFQIDPKKSVEMDKDLFLSASAQDQIETLREEIMVLYLERKALPAVVEHGELLKKLLEFEEVVCHFITNLCGNGHSWLRTYGLNHYDILKNVASYPLTKMQNFVNSFRRDGIIATSIEDKVFRIETLDQFLEYHKLQKESTCNENEIYNRSLLNILDDMNKEKKNKPKKEKNNILEKRFSKNFLEANTIHGYNICIDKKGVNLNLDCNEKVYEYLKTKGPLGDLLNEYFGDKKNTSDVILLSGNLIYNVRQGFAFCVDDSILKLFIIETTETTFGVHSFVIENHNGSYNNTQIEFFVDERRTTYYVSTCDGGYDKEIERQFLNHYGSQFEEFDDILENLARMRTDCNVDEHTDDYDPY